MCTCVGHISRTYNVYMRTPMKNFQMIDCKWIYFLISVISKHFYTAIFLIIPITSQETMDGVGDYEINAYLVSGYHACRYW